MPIFDGLELAQMIRQPGANANPYVAIIMLTGHSADGGFTKANKEALFHAAHDIKGEADTFGACLITSALPPIAAAVGPK